MRLKKIMQLADAYITCRAVKIFFDDETEEFICQLWISGKHYEPADYFTSDYSDAQGTAMHMCKAVK